MRRIALIAIVIALLTATTLLLLTPKAWSVPSYSRRYGMECSGCHTMWGALNGAGVTFRLSGYRAINGKDLTPVDKDIEISPGVFLPSTFPLSIITGVGFDSRSEQRDSSVGTSSTQRGASLDLEDASLFLTSPIGPHLSAFIEFPMYETKEGEFLPVGRADADSTATGALQFRTEKPTFEVAKFWWNNLFGDSAPRDSVNLLAGITQLPLGYASGKVRLSVNQYPIYERRALDLIIGQSRVDGAISDDFGLFRLSEPQVIFEVNGMIVPGKEVVDVSKKETFWFEYHAGVTNGSQDKADNNTKKDLYGRFVMRWYRQSLGFFGYYSPDQYSDTIQAAGAAAGFMKPSPGGHSKNSASRLGIDATLSLVAVGIPVWLENQYMMNRESDPTGYGVEFKWKGGFDQLNWQISKRVITYARYDWIRGNSFNDAIAGGTTISKPQETDGVAGLQYLIQQNVKFIAEYRHDVFKDEANNPGPARITSDGYTARVMVGF